MSIISRLILSLERIAETMEATELRERLTAQDQVRFQLEQIELLRTCQDQNAVSLERRAAWEQIEIAHMATCDRRFHAHLRREHMLGSVN